MAIKAGCSGWPVGQAEYYKHFSTIEINSSFYNLPRLATVERWRKAAPKDFEFSLKCWQLVTHPSSSPSYSKLTGLRAKKSLAHCGNFRSNGEVDAAWEGTRAVARALNAKFILFETPSSFYPNADHLRDIYRFFKNIRRDEEVCFVWEPRGDAWEARLIGKVCRDLGLVHGVDPMAGQPAHGSVQYFRLRGRYEGHRLIYSHAYSDAQLRHLIERCGQKATYIYFANTPMYDDAKRFNSLADPASAPRERSYSLPAAPSAYQAATSLSLPAGTARLPSRVYPRSAMRMVGRRKPRSFPF